MTGALGAGLLTGTRAFGVPEPYARTGGRLSVGLAAYSFRNHFAVMKGKPNPRSEGKEIIDMPGFIQFCAEHGAAGAELTSYFFPPEVDRATLAECRKVAHLSGVAVAGTAVGNNFSHPAGSPELAEQMDYVKEWIDHATVLGAPHIRVFAGKHPKGVSPEEAEKNAIAALEEAADYAGKRGVFLGIENHDSIGTADRLLRIVQAVKSPWLGVNLDSGNFRSDDPYGDMRRAAPFAVNVQLKTELRIGKKKQPCDFAKVVDILHEAGYSGYATLEYEENENPFEAVPPILEELNGLCG